MTTRSPELPSHPPLWVSPQLDGPGGLRNLLVVAIPMIASAMVSALNLFFDRLFVSKYDLKEHFAAAMPAGFTWWAVNSFFVALVGYTSTFVAQYSGAGRRDRIGSVVWQGIYLALVGGLFGLLMRPLAGPLFALFHHPGRLPELEAMYFATMCYGSVFMALNTAIGCFYSGRGKTNVMLAINTIVTIANIALAWWLVLDPLPKTFPAPAWIDRGLEGAAWASNISFIIGTVLFAACLFTPGNEEEFNTRSAWRLDWPLMKRVCRFGLPSAIDMVVNMIAFDSLLLSIGVLGAVEMAASNIAFNINSVLFIPMIGLSGAVSVIVGQAIGARDLPAAHRVTSLACLLCLVYMAATVVFYVGFPDPMIRQYGKGTAETDFAAVYSLTRKLLIFVAVYSLSDAISLIYSGALRGAGDTSFVMWMSISCSWFILTLPCVAAAYYKWSVYANWSFCAAYIGFLGFAFLGRYWHGRWQTMSVIEPELTTRLEVPMMEGAPALAEPDPS